MADDFISVRAGALRGMIDTIAALTKERDEMRDALAAAATATMQHGGAYEARAICAAALDGSGPSAIERERDELRAEVGRLSAPDMWWWSDDLSDADDSLANAVAYADPLCPAEIETARYLGVVYAVRLPGDAPARVEAFPTLAEAEAFVASLAEGGA